MDPWLERYWGDLHTRYVTSTANQLNTLLPRGLIAAVEETTRIIDPHRNSEWYFPDVTIIERSPEPGGGGTAVMAGVATPVMLRTHLRAIQVKRVEIRAAGEGPVITVFEIISPANKLDRKNRDDYRNKRADFHDASVNVVEIDLIRAGRPIVDAPEAQLEATPDLDTPYKCCVWRASEASLGAVAYYPLPLRQRLPKIRIPLRPTDEDLIFDLQEPIDIAYREGRFADRIDYSKPPVPPLPAEDAAWAEELLARHRSSPEGN